MAVEKACRNIVETFGLAMTPEEFAVRWGERFFDAIECSNHDRFQSLYECELTSLSDTLEPLVGRIDPVPFVREIESYWAAPPIHPDAAEFLERLDLPVVCVSNADAAPLQAAICLHGLRFDHILSSETARCYKPDAGIFDQAIEWLGHDPGDIVHVGDSLHSDIAGAAKRGLATVWVCREDRIHDIGTARPDRTISTLLELSDLLDVGLA